jgi:photosystem II stability/assembly factor-like uncharacterized protein
MSKDDDFEGRLRSALTSGRTSDRFDADSLLDRVHRGARVRRLRRGGALVAAAAVLVAGAGLVGGVTGVLGSPRGSTAANGVLTPPVARGGEAPNGQAPEPSVQSTRHRREPQSESLVTIAAHGPIAASEVTPVSITATGSQHQWVLAETPGRDCGRPKCATVFATTTHGSSWSDVGQLPAAPATIDNPTLSSVSQLRFARRDDTTYDGWAFGGALWSTHDSGHTWSRSASPPGRVTALEAWGGQVFAGVSSTRSTHSATLYRSPQSTDEWTRVDLGVRLHDVEAIATSMGVVALIDSDGDQSLLYVSRDGGSTWQSQDACPSGSAPASLSTAGNSAGSVASLWVTCTSATQTYIRYEDTDRWGQWMTAMNTFGRGIALAARTPMQGFAAGPGVPVAGIDSVSSAANASSSYAGNVGAPVYFGFTNPRDGYLLTSDGTILSTQNRGDTWVPYAVRNITR